MNIVMNDASPFTLFIPDNVDNFFLSEKAAYKKYPILYLESEREKGVLDI